MAITEQTILLVSDDASLWAAARRELETREGHPRIVAVSSVDAAHRDFRFVVLSVFPQIPARNDQQRRASQIHLLQSELRHHAQTRMNFSR